MRPSHTDLPHYQAVLIEWCESDLNGFAPNYFLGVQMEWLLQDGRSSEPNVKCSSGIRDIH